MSIKKQSKKVITFKEWYDSLPKNEQILKRDKIIEVCEWSKPSFYRILNNDQLLTQLEKKAINEIAKVDVFAVNANTILAKFKMVESANKIN